MTISEIARSAGLSQGLLYSHYASKDMLVAELVRQAVCHSSERMLDLAQADMPAVAKIQRITAMMCRMLSEAQRGIDYFMFMVQVGMGGYKVPESICLQSPTESLSRIIAQGQ